MEVKNTKELFNILLQRAGFYTLFTAVRKGTISYSHALKIASDRAEGFDERHTFFTAHLSAEELGI